MIRSMIICLLAATTALAFPADSPAGGCPGGYAEGAEIERGRLIFICQGGQVVPKGCIAEDLSRLSIGGNYDTKQYRKKCQLGSDGQLAFEVTGCIANGQEHKVDETFEDGTNFFVCKTDGAVLKIVNQGCVDGGKRINKKDTVAKDDALFSCDETVNGGSKLVQAGCVKDGKQYKTGDSFEVGKQWFNCTRTGREKVVAKAAGCVANGKRLNEVIVTTRMKSTTNAPSKPVKSMYAPLVACNKMAEAPWNVVSDAPGSKAPLPSNTNGPANTTPPPIRPQKSKSVAITMSAVVSTTSIPVVTASWTKPLSVASRTVAN